MKIKLWLSVLLAIIAWCMAAFMAQPTIASFLVHFLCLPAVLGLMIVVAHWEGRRA